MILSGKKASEELFTKLQPNISSLPKPPTLSAIQVGDNPASSTYIRMKKKKIESLGMKFVHTQLPENCTEEQLENIIYDLNHDNKITGILLQLPLPEHLQKKERALLNLIHPQKDVDCLTSRNIGAFFTGESQLLPATPLGVLRLLEYYEIKMACRITIIGRSNLVGKPLAIALTNRNATVTLCHSCTENLYEITRRSDIVITAVGKPNYFTKEYFHNRQVVIDIGISKTPTGELSGDVEFLTVRDHVRAITPVPGGVGPMTIYGLVENLVLLASEPMSS